MLTDHVLATAKFYAALIGLVATALLGTLDHGTTGVVLTTVVAVAGAVATFAVPNETAEKRQARKTKTRTNETGASTLETVWIVVGILVAIVVVLWLVRH